MARAARERSEQERETRGGYGVRVNVTVNGVDHSVDHVWALESLLDFLRERVGLRGTKNACEQGECGSCSVYVDGVLVCSCLVAVGQVEGCSVVTVEGLAPGDGMHPVQQAFVDAGAVQCGFCTPGMVVAAHCLLAGDPDPDDLTVREQLSGHQPVPLHRLPEDPRCGAHGC